MYRITVQSTPHREFHDEAPNSSPAKKEDLLRMGRKMTLHQEEVRLNILKILYFFLILSSLALEGFVCITWAQTDSYLLLALAGTTSMTIIGSVLGLIGSFVAIKELKVRPQSPAPLHSNTPGQNLLIFSFYFLLYIFSSYLVFGSGALFFQDQSLTFLEAKHSDEAAWASNFSSKGLSEVLDFTSLMITIAGYSCFITNVIIGVSIYYIFVLSSVWEVIHKVLMVICIVLLFLGLGILYLAGIGELMIKYLDFEDIVPGWVSLAAIVVGALICFSAFQGYIMAHGEKIPAIRCFILIQMLVLGTSLIFGIGALMSATHFREKLNTSCYDTLSLIDRDYTPVLGCDQKYHEVARTEAQLSCPKEQVRVLWETELDSQGVLYGCLNSECCGSLVASSKSVFDYMGIQALAAVIIVSVAFWGISYLVEKVKKFGVSPNHDKDYRFLLSMIFFSAAFALILYTNLRLHPRQPPHKSALLVVSNGGVVDPLWLQAGECYHGLQLPTFEDFSQKCPSCDSSKTYITVSTVGGRVYKPEKASVEDLETRTDFWQFASGKANAIDKAIAELTVCPLCPGTGLQVEVLVTQQDSNNHQQMQLANVTFTLSAGSTATQTLSGKVQGEGSSDAPVRAEFGIGCAPVTTTTDSQGRFTLKLPLTSDQSPYAATILLPNGLKRVQQVGGIPSSNIPLPTLEKPPTSTLLSRLTVRVVDSYHGFPLSNSTVYLRENSNNMTGPALAVSQADGEGASLFSSLPTGVYTLVASANGHTSDVVDVTMTGGAYLEQVLQLGLDNLGRKQARVHLTWSDSDLDLDLRTAFQLSADYFCHVYYAETYCGSAKLTKQTRPGLNGEVLLLREMSAGQYLIYVTPYAGSKGLTERSKAEIKVYVSGLSLPVFRLQVPSTMGQTDEYFSRRMWLALCIDGAQGVQSLLPVHRLVTLSSKPDLDGYCQEFYGPSSVVWPVNSTETVARPRNSPPAGTILHP